MMAMEVTREIWGWTAFERARQDLTFGARMLLKNPGFTVAAVLTLALGIGATTSIFSIVNSVLLRALPYKEPDRIVQFWETNSVKGWNDDKAACSPANFLDWRERSRSSFEEIAAYYAGNYKSGDPKSVGLSDFYLTSGDTPERLQGLQVTGDIFSVLGVYPEIGRPFQPEEMEAGQNHVVILSRGLWQRRFGADRSIVGRDIQLNGVKTTVIGVMPSSFYFPTTDVDLWTPWGRSKQWMLDFRHAHNVRVIARLKPGVTLGQAQAEMSGIAGELAKEYPATNENAGVGLALMRDWNVKESRFALYLFLGAVAFVLLIACANVANLQMARGAARAKEFSLRAALGAGRLRLIRQLLTENILLSVLGGAVGLILANFADKIVAAWNPGGIPRLDEVRLDFRVIGFTVAITFLTIFLFGLFPAIASTRTDLNESLKGAGQKGGRGGKGTRMQEFLVVAEVALSLVLLIGAGLMIKSFVRLNQVNPGFNPTNILTLRTNLPSSNSKYNSSSKQLDFYQQVLERIRALPGVQSADAVSVLPTKGSTYTDDFLTVDGRTSVEPGTGVLHNVVTPNYFATMKIPVISGRSFSDSDTGQNLVVIISDQLAHRSFSGQSPIGQRVAFGRPNEQRSWYTIVGVVGDVKQEGLAVETRPEVYEPFPQMGNNYMSFVIRTSADPATLISAVRAEIKAVDKDVPPYNISSMEEVLRMNTRKQQFTTLLLIVFAAVALLLASIGIYGVLSYAVSQRTSEMGIRMALGAERRDVLTLIIGQGFKLIILGLAAGLIGAFGLTRLMISLLFDVSSTDPATFAAVPVLLTLVALAACYIPARRATRVNPLIALRYE